MDDALTQLENHTDPHVRELAKKARVLPEQPHMQPARDDEVERS